MKYQTPIIVIDERPEVREELWELIAQLGYSNLSRVDADSGASGIGLFKEHLAPIVFAGYESSVMPTTELIQALRAEHSNVMIAIYTKLSEEQVVIECMKAGASDFLKRPFVDADVNSVVSRFLAALLRRRSKMFDRDLLNVGTIDVTIPTARGAIGPTVNAVVNVLSGFLPERELMRVELALEEIVRNAFEHGNLEISFAEKSQACDTGTFEKLVEERSKAANEAGKSIRIVGEITPNEFRCRIEDQGKGFNWRELPDPEGDPTALLRLHGRGLLYARKVFDRIEFSDKGNVTYLTKVLRKEE